MMLWEVSVSVRGAVGQQCCQSTASQWVSLLSCHPLHLCPGVVLKVSLLHLHQLQGRRSGHSTRISIRHLDTFEASSTCMQIQCPSHPTKPPIIRLHPPPHPHPHLLLDLRQHRGRHPVVVQLAVEVVVLVLEDAGREAAAGGKAGAGGGGAAAPNQRQHVRRMLEGKAADV